MKQDERVKQDIYLVRSIGYTILWFGTFGILLYRWFYLNQPLAETLDFFLLWITVSILAFVLLAYRGVPMHYPVILSKKEQRWVIPVVSLFAGIASTILLIIREAESKTILVGGVLSSVFTLFIFLIYYMVLYLWEKKMDDIHTKE